MQIQPQKLKCEFKRSVGSGCALFLFVVMCAGCASTPPEQSHVKIQSGQTSAEVYWPK